ncbi:hypothetical protein CALVIDRAFT_536598 [Calocera viscosa TUFC12733]|uniref:Uncharacterized protein n=1 Tax=Calocera viscosa (strain TUFC12733) TaxID=1330018 RepID=A0A167MWM1_CALVF|nr:hypothetical protein CALVIDRAFT_536598 [Calocera viscosa TUFC12733]
MPAIARQRCQSTARRCGASDCAPSCYASKKSNIWFSFPWYRNARREWTKSCLFVAASVRLSSLGMQHNENPTSSSDRAPCWDKVHLHIVSGSTRSIIIVVIRRESDEERKSRGGPAVPEDFLLPKRIKGFLPPSYKMRIVITTELLPKATLRQYSREFRR